MPKSAQEQSLIGQIRVNRRHHPDHPERVEDQRRELRALSAARYIKELVDSAPTLNEEQRIRLAEILRPAVHASTVVDGGDA